jgi:signal transduction histidine kinase
VIESHHAHVPIELNREVIGAFAAWTPSHRTLDGTDETVMRILASQTAVALQNCALFGKSQALLARSERAYAEASRHAVDLAARNAELVATQRELDAAQRHQVLDSERHRIARELHDSVTQCVLSAGMQIEVCRSEAQTGSLGTGGEEVVARLDLAKDLTRSAVEQLRSAIYALNRPGDARRTSLPEMLEQLATVHMPEDLRVSLQMRGSVAELPNEVEHALLRIAGEALFNTAMHGNATRAIVRLTYRPTAVTLSIADDGTGDPDKLRLMLRLADATDVDGHHRGLANMLARAREHGGTFEVARSRIGGVRVVTRIPRAAEGSAP